MLASASANAQTNAASTAIETVVVSSTRILNSGYDSPTPTTVISSEDLTRQAADNVFTTITQLPALQGSTGVTVGSGGSSGGNDGLSSLNIRGIGTSRNLILIDGERIVPSAAFGVIDVSLIPQVLIQRVDVVTGGSSASWGSDAVSGVVNFVTDTKFTGFKANIQAGVTTYADDPTALIQVAAGVGFDHDRGHVEIGIDLDSEAGVDSVIGPRKWYKNPESVQYSLAQTPAGMPQYYDVYNAKDYQFSTGGLVTNGPLQGTAFGKNGVPYTFNYGVGPANGLAATPSGLASGAVNNCFGSFCVGGDTSAAEGGYGSMVTRLARGNFFGRVDYELTPDINLYATAIESEEYTTNKPTFGFYKNANLNIGCDNAFLPVSIAALCATDAAQPGSPYAPTAAFPKGSMQYGVQNGILTPVQIQFDRATHRYVVGADGDFGLFGSDWTYKAYGEDGRSGITNHGYNLIITPYYNAAIDAVLNPATGVIQCRSAAAVAIGCQPLDVIGTNPPTLAAQQFVQGVGNSGANVGPATREGAWSITDLRQDVLDFSMSGSPFSDWAGKVSIATGYQYREEAFVQTSDCISQGNCGGNPVLNGIGGNWYAGNFQPGAGTFHENEVFLETLVPLLDSDNLGKVNVSVAGRETDYSTSGYVSTWKLGSTWDTPIDGFRLRALQSRDVRAPNLAELFGSKTNNGQVTDDFAPFAGQVFTVQNPATANPLLKPEKGYTTELGAVYQPDWFPGFNSSVDYYRVSVRGLIGSVSTQAEMDLCFSGNALQCSFISRDSTGRVSRIVTPTINLASLVTDGVDYNLDYRFAMDDAIDWGLGGDVTLKALATNVSKFITNSGIIGAVPVESAGTNSGSTPHWKVSLTEAYDAERWGIFLNQRWFSVGVANRAWIQCDPGSCPLPTVNNPTTNNDVMPAEIYADIGGHYNASDITQIYFKIDNMFNQNPANAVAWSNSPQGPLTNPALYDTLGRFYHVGVRITP